MALRIYTGNRVADGIVVYLDDVGGWTETVSQSRLVAPSEDKAAATEMAGGARGLLIGGGGGTGPAHLV